MSAIDTERRGGGPLRSSRTGRRQNDDDRKLLLLVAPSRWRAQFGAQSGPPRHLRLDENEQSVASR